MTRDERKKIYEAGENILMQKKIALVGESPLSEERKNELLAMTNVGREVIAEPLVRNVSDLEEYKMKVAFMAKQLETYKATVDHLAGLLMSSKKSWLDYCKDKVSFVIDCMASLWRKLHRLGRIALCNGDKFVVRSPLGKWRECDIVSRRQLIAAGADADRLLLLNVICKPGTEAVIRRPPVARISRFQLN